MYSLKTPCKRPHTISSFQEMERLTLARVTNFRELFEPSDVYIYYGYCGDRDDWCYESNAQLKNLNFVSAIRFFLEFFDYDINSEFANLVLAYVEIIPLVENTQFDPYCNPNRAKISTLNGTLQTKIFIGYHCGGIEAPSTEDAEAAITMSALLRSGEWQVVCIYPTELSMVRDFIDNVNNFAEELRYFAIHHERRQNGGRTKAASRVRQVIPDEPVDEPDIESFDIAIANLSVVVTANVLPNASAKSSINKSVPTTSTYVPLLDITIDLFDLGL